MNIEITQRWTDTGFLFVPEVDGIQFKCGYDSLDEAMKAIIYERGQENGRRTYTSRWHWTTKGYNAP